MGTIGEIVFHGEFADPKFTILEDDCWLSTALEGVLMGDGDLLIAGQWNVVWPDWPQYKQRGPGSHSYSGGWYSVHTIEVCPIFLHNRHWRSLAFHGDWAYPP